MKLYFNYRSTVNLKALAVFQKPLLLFAESRGRRFSKRLVDRQLRHEIESVATPTRGQIPPPPPLLPSLPPIRPRRKSSSTPVVHATLTVSLVVVINVKNELCIFQSFISRGDLFLYDKQKQKSSKSDVYYFILYTS